MLNEGENDEINGEKRRVTLFNISTCENGPVTQGEIWRDAEKAVPLHRHSETNGLIQKSSMTSKSISSITKLNFKLTTKKQKHYEKRNLEADFANRHHHPHCHRHHTRSNILHGGITGSNAGRAGLFYLPNEKEMLGGQVYFTCPMRKRCWEGRFIYLPNEKD